MIGKTVTFIVSEDTGRGYKNKQYTGTIIDKCRGKERVEGRWFAADYYLVELDDKPGIIAKFFCTQAVKLESKFTTPQPNQQPHEANATSQVPALPERPGDEQPGTSSAQSAQTERN